MSSSFRDREELERQLRMLRLREKYGETLIRAEEREAGAGGFCFAFPVCEAEEVIQQPKIHDTAFFARSRYTEDDFRQADNSLSSRELTQHEGRLSVLGRDGQERDDQDTSRQQPRTKSDLGHRTTDRQIQERDREFDPVERERLQWSKSLLDEEIESESKRKRWLGLLKCIAPSANHHRDHEAEYGEKHLAGIKVGDGGKLDDDACIGNIPKTIYGEQKPSSGVGKFDDCSSISHATAGKKKKKSFRPLLRRYAHPSSLTKHSRAKTNSTTAASSPTSSFLSKQAYLDAKTESILQASKMSKSASLAKSKVSSGSSVQKSLSSTTRSHQPSIQRALSVQRTGSSQRPPSRQSLASLRHYKARALDIEPSFSDDSGLGLDSLSAGSVADRNPRARADSWDDSWDDNWY